MRILQILPSLNRGGAEQVVLVHSKALLDRNHHVTIITKGIDNIDLSFALPKGVTSLIVSRSTSNWRLFSFLILFWWIVRNRKKLLLYDVIHAHLTYGAIFVIILRLVSFRSSSLRPKIVFTHHSSGMDAPFISNFIQFFSKFFVHEFIFVAQENSFLKKLFFPFSNSCRIISNGIEFSLDLVNDGVKVEEDYRSKYKFVTVGAISRLTPDRNPFQYLDLFEELMFLESDLQMNYVLGGYGSLFEEVKNRIQARCYGDKIELPGLVLDRKEFFRKIDIYITLVANDYPGISGLEAISHGIPTFGILINDNTNQTHSFPIPSFRDVGALAQCIINFCQLPNTHLSFIKRQLSWASSNYSIQKMCENYLDCYSIR